eukprot:13987624-Ditylum_brightwellii.AAC.1
MPRAKRKADRKYSVNHKRNKAADLSDHDDSMDHNHPDVGEKSMEEWERRDTDRMNKEYDGADDEGENIF